MALFILLALVGIPLVEIAVFIRVSGEIGLGLTLLTTVLTAVAGTILLRTQGLSTLRNLQQTLDRGEMPVRAAFDGVCQLVAGLLLLTPGFVTDFIGLLLFVPPLRAALLLYIISRASISMVMRADHPPGHPSGRPHGQPEPGGYDVDGEYTDVSAQHEPRLSPPKDVDKS